MQFEVRRLHNDEHERVRSLVSDVVNETYGSIWPTTPIDVGSEEWGDGWVAVAGDDLLGWMLTKDDWLDDLWSRPGTGGKALDRRCWGTRKKRSLLGAQRWRVCT